ncbi:hypothetical protein CR513_10948, partial [Mucuna pruriens]
MRWKDRGNTSQGERHEEEPCNEQRGRNDISPHRLYVEEHRRAPMDLLKCHIPLFDEARDVEAYLDWEIKGD